MNKYILLCTVLCFVFNGDFLSQVVTLDDFENLSGWQIITSEGVDVKISSVNGIKGKALKLEYDFKSGAGYGGIQKQFPVVLPNHYQFDFFLRAESPNNNFEFKLLDKSGENVWWKNNRNYEFLHEWKKMAIKKRHINFAWGPTADNSLKEFDKLEFTIASFNGGKGEIFLDELTFETIPDSELVLKEPKVLIDENVMPGLKFVLDNNDKTFFEIPYEKFEITIDLGGRREFSALKIIWGKDEIAQSFDIYGAAHQEEWGLIKRVTDNKRHTSYVFLPDAEARYLKIIINDSAANREIAIGEIEIKSPEYAASSNDFFINVCKDFPRGYYPRYFNEEASYWNIIGVSGDEKEALINEDGMIEVDKNKFSLEPFIYLNNKFITWHDAEKIQSLLNDYLPIPAVTWKTNKLELTVTAFASGETNKSSYLNVIYTLKNLSDESLDGNFYLAIRPFQVNPYYQFLNNPGGTSRINSIKEGNELISIDDKVIIPLFTDYKFGAASFNEGDIIEYISKNILPPNKSAIDSSGFCSGTFDLQFSLKPYEEKSYPVIVPFHRSSLPDNWEEIKSNPDDYIEREKTKAKNFWEKKLNKVSFSLTGDSIKLINTIKSNIAYILINRDNFGIQPGSRSYERSWIRDGALTSSALLKFGLHEEVKHFIDWYSGYQFENGKIPCVVDKRGGDPTPENDSHGEFIFLIKEYFNFTKDTTYLKSLLPKVLKAVDYIELLTSQRSTEFYKNSSDSLKAFYGLVPESISHEGYSAKPMHSYWDDFWTLKGLKDAVEICQLTGDEINKARITLIRDNFKTNLYNSIRLATVQHQIDYLPGCVELGDFDATSTTIAVYPCNELNNLPNELLQNTFDKYYDNVIKREVEKSGWLNYTPYEVRTIGTFIMLNQFDRVENLINNFLNNRRPQGWNHWAEVVWNDERVPRFIGDMPHTWVGSDFINSIRNMFVYENEYDSSLVVFSAFPGEWLTGLRVENLYTYNGILSYSVSKNNEEYTVEFYGDLELPSGGLVIKNVFGKLTPAGVNVNDKAIRTFNDNEIRVYEFPCKVQININ